MKPIPAAALWLMTAIIASVVAGCATFQSDLSVVNTLPVDAPKGYIEFYSEESEDAIKLYNDLSGAYTIYQDENGEVIELKSLVWDWRTRRRIAVRPGKRIFVVKLMSAEQTVTVDVNEDMLLPIKIIIKLKGGTVFKDDFDQIELDSSDIFQKLIQNGWGTQVYSKSVQLAPNFEEDKEQMAKIFGEDSSKIFPILRQAPYGSAHYHFNMTLCVEGATPFVTSEIKK